MHRGPRKARKKHSPGVQVDSMRATKFTYFTYSHIDHSPGVQVDSMREAVLIVSPKMENFGSLLPTSPVTCRDQNATKGEIKRAIHACTAIDSVHL